ncbi:MAG: hypothetical protein ACI8SR_003110 [Oceanicoccus sp.]|jgi:hypothetical protein
MIQVVSGHLGSGNWRFKEVNGITVLAHMQPFNADGEFRIGPDQVTRYEVEQTDGEQIIVNIHFSDERNCRAVMAPSDLAHLEVMVSSDQSVPEFKHSNRLWIKGFIGFLIACLVFEFIK